jgi:hypothetical protein
MWKRSSCGTTAFAVQRRSRGRCSFSILSGRKFKSPSLEAQSKLLLLFLDKDPCDYFKARSSQAIAFKKIQDACKSGWKTEASGKKKWSVFVAEHLALLLVIRRQVEKEKEAQEAIHQTTRASSLSKAKGVPKATDLKRAFRKL